MVWQTQGPSHISKFESTEDDDGDDDDDDNDDDDDMLSSDVTTSLLPSFSGERDQIKEMDAIQAMHSHLMKNGFTTYQNIFLS